MEPTRYDLTARRVARLDPAGFFAWLLTDFTQSLRFAGWLDPRSTPEGVDPEVIGDTVARLEAFPVKGPPWMFPVEFQTAPDPAMFGRLNKQIGEWWSDLRPDELPDSRFQVAVAVVNLTGTPRSAPASRAYRFPTADGLYWGGKVQERHLAEESADETLTRVERGEVASIILALIPLMHGADEAGILSRWKAAAGQVTDARRRADLGSMALTLGALKEWYPVWQDALKEWHMVESPYVLELTAGAKREGELKGKLEGKHESLRMLLEERFGALPSDLVQRIAAVTDLNQVDQLFRAAVRVNRPEELPL